jgi:hypothetical protein
MTTTLNASNSGSGGLVATADASGVLALQTAGTTAVTVDTSQRVGIGTTSPDTILNIQGVDPTFLIQDSDEAGDGFIKFQTANGTQRAFIQAAMTANVMLLGVGTSEAMRIDSSGNVLVGTTTSGGKQTVTQSADATTAQFNNSAGTLTASIPGIQVSYSGAIPNNTGQAFLFMGDYSALRAQVRSNGGLANYSANNVNLSDRREKTNFAPSKSYLDVICAIPVQTFNYIDQNTEEDAGLTLGVVAQDVQAVAPELVMESNWGTEEAPKMRLSIYQTDLQYALMKCIQEQQALITSLTARIAALEGTPA